ncbi:hypothetical protein CALCODRAFT_486150 [Calocera cornea HHB12733]|uniref:Replication factor A C-terminal domain-containing protein n=1 Tax=Calocera cornea HHB12733 TaxID=1353952 RepID=A0A165DWQ4_9BASI|nr:hypothetical protein CALCODRAFT_486150 [Calocera cornea HHB12733]
MGTGQPDHYNAVLQVVRIDVVMDPVRNEPAQPADWSVVMADATRCLRVIPRGRMRQEISSGTLPVWAVIEVFEYMQGTPEGSNRGVVVIKDYARLRNPGRFEGASMSQHYIFTIPDIGTGEIPDNAHLQAGFPMQLHAPRARAANAAQKRVMWRTVRAEGNSDRPPEPTTTITPRTVVVPMHPNAVFTEVAQIRKGVRVDLACRVYEQNPPRHGRQMVVLIDRTGEIEFMAFGDFMENTADMVFGTTWRIQGAEVTENPDEYGRVPHKYRLVWDKHTTKTAIPAGPLPLIFFNYSLINEIERMDQGRVVDLMAVVLRVANRISSGVLPGAKPTKGHRQAPSSSRVEAWFLDDTKVVVRGVFFDNTGNQFIGREGQVVLLKAVTLSWFNGPCLKSERAHTRVFFDHNNPSAQRLLQWYQSENNDNAQWRTLTGGYSADGHPLPNFVMPNATYSIAHAINKKLGAKSKTTFYIEANLKLEIGRPDYIYLGCPYDECNKKFLDEWQNADQSWTCRACGVTFPVRGPKYHLNFAIKDGSMQQWTKYIHVFNGAATRLLNQTAGTMYGWMMNRAYIPTFEAAILAPNAHRWRIVIEATASRDSRYKDRINWVALHFERL